jgi:hypothetical protein
MPTIGIGPEISHGFSAILNFEVPNPAAGATTAGTLAQGNTYLVPPGFNAHIVGVTAAGNDPITAQSAAITVRSNGAAIASFPTTTLTALVQRSGALAYLGQAVVPGGAQLDVALTTPVGYLPITADYDVCVHIVLMPA